MLRLRPRSPAPTPEPSSPTRARRRGRPSTGDDTDAELVRRFRQGDESAFRKLVAKYTNLVGSIAYNIVNDPHLAGDITQEVFFKVCKNIQTLQDPRKFKGWLCCIVRTTCIDHLRRDRLHAASLEKIAEDGVEPEDAILNGTVEAPSLETEELRERVLQAIRSLPDIYQQILILRHMRRMSYRDMSRHLGVQQATIESRLYRARLMLKEKLRDYLP